MMLAQLRNVLYKSASEDDAAAQAMAGAASAAKPSWAPALPDFSKKKSEDEEKGPDLTKELQQRDKEIERLNKEKRIVEQNLQFEQIKSKQNEASRQLEQQARQHLDKIRQEQQKLDQKKIMSQAEDVKHQATLAKQESDSQLRIQQDKNKSIMDLNNQQLKMQMSTQDQLMKQHMQHADNMMKLQMSSADKARAAADKYKDDARKQIDKERSDMHKAYTQAHSGVSPALTNMMNGAIKSLSQFGKPQTVKIPNAGKSPVKQACIDIRSRLKFAQATEQQLNKQASAAPINIPLRVTSIPGSRGNILVKRAIDQASLQTGNTSTDKNKTTLNKDPHQNLFFGHAGTISQQLGSIFGPWADFNKSVDTNNLNNQSTPPADRINLVNQYKDKMGQSPTVERLTGNKEVTPGQSPLQQHMQYSNNNIDFGQFTQQPTFQRF